MFVDSYTAETLVGDTDSQRAAPLRFLAPRFLGMDRRCGSVCISLRGSLLNTRADRSLMCGFESRGSVRNTNRIAVDGVLLVFSCNSKALIMWPWASATLNDRPNGTSTFSVSSDFTKACGMVSQLSLAQETP